MSWHFILEKKIAILKEEEDKIFLNWCVNLSFSIVEHDYYYYVSVIIVYLTSTIQQSNPKRLLDLQIQ